MQQKIGNKNKDSFVKLLNSDDGSLTDSNDVAQKINDHFSQFGKRLSDNFNDCKAFQRSKWHIFQTSSYYSKSAVLSAGAYDLSMHIHTKNVTFLGSIIPDIWNESISLGKFPH